MEEMRQHRRHKLPLRVEIQHKSIGTLLVEANDMSDGGVFLVLDECFQLDVGETVRLRSVGLGVDGDETGPELDMKVVRRNELGMGLAIIEEGQTQHDQQADVEAADGPAAQPEAAERLAQAAAILQRYLFIDDQDRVLLQRQGDHWHLPARELASHERWSEGLQHGLDEVVAAGIIAPPQTIASTNQCAANKDSLASCTEFLIPCRVFNGTDSDVQEHSNYRWARLDELTAQNLCFDRHTVDILLSRI